MENGLLHRFVAGLTGLGVLGLVLLPAEHVHSGRTHDGRHPGVIHRHVEPHHLEGHGAKATFDHDGEDDARYLSAVFVVQRTVSRLDPNQPLVIADLPLASSLQMFWRALPSLNVRGHDPPWRTTSGPRAPPSARLA